MTQYNTLWRKAEKLKYEAKGTSDIKVKQVGV
jgi:hypothetical protein